MNAQTNKASWDEFVRLSAHGPTPGAGQVALVPGAAVPVLTLDLPRGVTGQAREQVALRQLRDRAGLTSAQIDMRPFAPTARTEGWDRVLLADPEALALWRQQAGQACRAVLPDYLALPTTEGLWTLRLAVDQLQARLGPNDGFSAPPDLALALLARALEGASAKPRAILLLGGPFPALEAWVAAQDIPLVTEAAALEPLGLRAPRVLAHGELAYDLRRDPQLARAHLQARLKQWRWAVLLGLLAAGLWTAAALLEIAQRRDQLAALQQETETMVRAHFVPEAPLLDLRVQVAQALALREAAAGTAARPETAGFALLARAAAVIVRAEARLISAQAQTGDRLTLVAELADFAAADRLSEALRADGLAVEVIETRVTDQAARVRSELRVTGAEQP